MPHAPFMKNSGLEDSSLDYKIIHAKITWATNATFASSTITSDNGGLFPYIGNAADPSSTSVDTAATFGSLAYGTASAQCGIICLCGDAAAPGYIHTVKAGTFTTNGTTWTGAITVGLKGASSTGMTTNKNIAFVVTWTTLDADANNETIVLPIEIHYKAVKV